MIAFSTDQVKTVKFWLPGRVVPKARPRFNGGNISLPRNYRGWKNTAYLEIISQLQENGIGELLIGKAPWKCNSLAATEGTQDNLAGSLLDILCETKIIKDDRVSCISRLVIEHEPGGVCGVWVKVNPL